MPAEHVNLHCPNCASLLQTSPETVGKLVTCPSCRKAFLLETTEVKCCECGGTISVDQSEFYSYIDCPICSRSIFLANRYRETKAAPPPMVVSGTVGDLDDEAVRGMAANPDLLLSSMEPMAIADERLMRQHRREFRRSLAHMYVNELEQLIPMLVWISAQYAGTPHQVIANLLADEVEQELAARLDESDWGKAKRVARRASGKVVDWLGTEQGKAAGIGAAVVAAFFGVSLFDRR